VAKRRAKRTITDARHSAATAATTYVSGAAAPASAAVPEAANATPIASDSSATD
jgi:hypothetical protein